MTALPAVAPLDASAVATPRGAAPARVRTFLRLLMDLLVLTKYRITAMALFTGYAAIAVHGRYAGDWRFVWPCLVALFCVGGCANTLNQIFERDKDAVMNRTKSRRPLPAGRISVRAAWCFAIGQGVIATAILGWGYHSPLAAGLGLFTIGYYSFFYTLYLKPRHYLNIVIGGVPGAMGPVIAWAAVAHEIAALPLAMFALIFLWTPPHVWALAIKLKEDYARAGIPMLPVVKGIDETTRQIFVYTVVLVAGTLALPLALPLFTPALAHSPIYTATALVLGLVFLVWTAILWKRRPVVPTMPLFRFTILYIGALFLGLVLDRLLAPGSA